MRRAWLATIMMLFVLFASYATLYTLVYNILCSGCERLPEEVVLLCGGARLECRLYYGYDPGSESCIVCSAVANVFAAIPSLVASFFAYLLVSSRVASR